jgi:hypothetical protein
MDYVHDVAQVALPDLVERGEHAERTRLGGNVGRVSADHNYTGLGRHVRGSPRSPRTRSCPVGTSEFPSREAKEGETHLELVEVTYTRRGHLYSSRRRVRDTVKVLRRRRGAVDERASDVCPAEKVSMMSLNAIRLPRSQAW